MKLVATLIAGLFAVSAFAQAPAKEAAKPAAPAASTAPAKDAKPADKSTPAKKEDKKAEPAKK